MFDKSTGLRDLMQWDVVLCRQEVGNCDGYVFIKQSDDRTSSYFLLW